MTQRVQNRLQTLKTQSKLMGGTSWMLLIQERDIMPKADLQHDEMTLKQSEMLSMQVYVMRMIFDFLSGVKKELEEVRSFLFRLTFLHTLKRRANFISLEMSLKACVIKLMKYLTSPNLALFLL